MSPSGARMLHRTLLRIALSAGHVFAWVFIFQYFYVRTDSIASALASAILTFALAQVATVLLTPISGARLRFGLRRLLVYATVILSVAFAVLAASFASYLGPVGWGVGIFALLMGTYRALYFTPYAVAEQSSSSMMSYVQEFLVAIAPAAAGLLLVSPDSVIALLGIVCLLACVSLLPLTRMPEIRESFQWNYRATFHELFARSRRRMLAESVMAGIEGAALLLLWPILIFILLEWSYLKLGLVLSGTFVLALILQFFFEKPVSRISASLAALINASAWLMRLTVAGAVGVVLVDTYFYLGSRPRGRGLDMHAFEQSADNATFVDEHTALKEMGMALGRIILCIIAAVLTAIVSIPVVFLVAFLIAAIAAASSVYLSR